VRTTIDLPDDALQSSSTIQVFNVLGEKKLEFVVEPKDNTFIFERQGMPVGIYYYRIVNDKDILGQGEFVIQ